MGDERPELVQRQSEALGRPVRSHEFTSLKGTAPELASFSEPFGSKTVHNCIYLYNSRLCYLMTRCARLCKKVEMIFQLEKRYRRLAQEPLPRRGTFGVRGYIVGRAERD